MTKRQLIDEILIENQTAEPAFLAQFDETDLQEYLTHLKSLHQPRLRGDASRFDRYFRDCPTITAAPRPRRWRTTGDLPAGATAEPDEAAETFVGVQPPEPAMMSTALPVPPMDFQAPLPEDIDALDAMQLTPSERTSLTAGTDEENEADVSADSPPSSSMAEETTDDQAWLF